MKNSRKVKFLIIFLFIIEMISLFFTIKSFSNKNIAETKEIYEIDKKQFSMYIENEEGNYEEYVESNKFPEGYQINIEKSKCVDTKGNVINGILTGSGTNITITSSKTSYCYLYFDINKLLGDFLINNYNNGLSSNLVGGMYRYQGTKEEIINNYICFGTDSISQCINNPSRYLYRIIGITENHIIKLIKQEDIGTMSWFANFETDEYGNDYLTEDASWLASWIAYDINGNKFLTNTTYVPIGWEDKIVDGFFKDIWIPVHSSVTESTGFYGWTLDEIYNFENYGTNLDLENGKIGLINVSDYYYGSKTVDCSQNTCESSWLNDVIPSGWTMSRYEGYQDGDFLALVIYDGTISGGYIADSNYVNPVFYLSNNTKYVSGNGMLNNPFIIE